MIWQLVIRSKLRRLWAACQRAGSWQVERTYHESSLDSGGYVYFLSIPHDESQMSIPVLTDFHYFSAIGGSPNLVHLVMISKHHLYNDCCWAQTPWDSCKLWVLFMRPLKLQVAQCYIDVWINDGYLPQLCHALQTWFIGSVLNTAGNNPKIAPNKRHSIQGAFKGSLSDYYEAHR